MARLQAWVRGPTGWLIASPTLVTSPLKNQSSTRARNYGMKQYALAALCVAYGLLVKDVGLSALTWMLLIYASLLILSTIRNS